MISTSTGGKTHHHHHNHPRCSLIPPFREVGSTQEKPRWKAAGVAQTVVSAGHVHWTSAFLFIRCLWNWNLTKLQLQTTICNAHSRHVPGTQQSTAWVALTSVCPQPAPGDTTWETRNQNNRATIKHLHPDYPVAAVTLLQDPSSFCIYSIKILPCIHNLRE